MKKLLATVAAVFVSLFALPNSAEAGVRVSIGTGYNYVSGHASCGCPIYTKRVVRGYDRYSRPIYNYYRQPFSCRCGHGRSSHVNFRQHGFVNRGFRSHSGQRNFGTHRNFKSNRNFKSQRNFRSHRGHSRGGFSNQRRGNFGRSSGSFRRSHR